MNFPLALLHPSAQSPWDSCQKDSDVLCYLCVTASCAISSFPVRLKVHFFFFFFFDACQVPRAGCWLLDTDGSHLILGLTNGSDLLWVSKLSSRIHLSNRTPVRALFLCLTPWPQGTRWWWAPGGMPGSLASDKLAHDQSAVGVIVNGERGTCWRSKVNSWLSTADSGPCEGGGRQNKSDHQLLIMCLMMSTQRQCKNRLTSFFYTLYYTITSKSMTSYYLISRNSCVLCLLN